MPRYQRAHLARCGTCRFVFAGRLPTAEVLTGHYEGYGRDDPDSPITRRRYDELLDGFESRRQTNRILDMGCGVGYFLEHAARRGWEVHGTEVGEEALELNRAKGIAMREAPASPEDYEPGSFDVVTAFEVVEHVADPAAEARTLARILRPDGGLFYCTTPNFASASRRLLGPAWSVIDFPEHLGYFTPATLRRWLEAEGFSAVRVTSTGVSPRRVLAGLRRAPGKAPGQSGGVPADDERVRAAIESSAALGAGKRAINAMLGALGAGDTVKAHSGCGHAHPSLPPSTGATSMARMRALRHPDRRFLLAVLAVVAVGAMPAIAAAQTPGVGGYAGTAPAAINQTAPPSGNTGVQGDSEGDDPAGAVNPGGTEGASGTAPTSTASASTGTLPFTGLQIGLMLFGGLALVGLGLTLRRTTAGQLPA